MSPEPLPDLLEKLCGGDPRAAEQVFLAYEPYLRLLVRRELPRPLRAPSFYRAAGVCRRRLAAGE